MTLRLFVAQPLAAGHLVELPAPAVHHLQVRRLQPGDALVLFDGGGGEWRAEVATIGRRDAAVRLLGFDPVQREPAVAVTLALGMPANERMDWLVEKATELGAARIVPLLCQRSVLRLSGERAAGRREHWQAVALAAAEQCGATRLTVIDAITPLDEWLGDGLQREAPQAERCLLSLAADAATQSDADAGGRARIVLSGPEGGFTEAEEAAARAAGFTPLSLGPRTLRAETAPLAALARWQVWRPGR
jgi:16S rRNA (uracil1498-N3)-methyltransferase